MAQNSPIKKSPVKSPVNVKTHQEALGFLFGRNLSTFDHLLPMKRRQYPFSTSITNHHIDC